MKQIIETLAQRVVLLEAGDLPRLAEMHTLFEKLAEEEGTDAKTEGWLPTYSRAAAERVQAILLQEVADTESALQELADDITALQQLLVEGRQPAEIRLPPSLAWCLESGTGTGAVGTREGAATSAMAEGGGPPKESETVLPLSDSLPFTGDSDLTAEFVLEAREHLDAADSSLLTLEKQPEAGESIHALFRAFHTLKGVAGFLDLQDVGLLAHHTENLLDKARQEKIQLTGECLDVVFDATDRMKQLVQEVTDALTSGILRRDRSLPELLDRLAACALLESEASVDAPQAPDEGELSLPSVSSSSSPSPSLSSLSGPIADLPSPDAAQADPSQQAVPEPGGKQPAARKEQVERRDGDLAPATPEKPAPAMALVRESVKVDSQRLDAMIDAIGELVIAEAMVTQSPRLRGLADEAVTARLNHLSKITRELQEMATSLRMVPVRATFQRMARLARDTAKKLQKQIVFSTVGEDTELDKNLVDQIGDPLIHMVRNAVDHGLEKRSEDRTAAGKDPVGRVELRAYHKGGSIYIEIADDGGGLDRDRILAKAIERGLVREDQKLHDAEIYSLIMEPGFSTASAVSDVSGRGVGMDVVKKNIQAMRGQIEIHSVPGEGTTFSIRLPLTLAIIEGMVVRVGSQRYVVPLLSITRMLRPEESHLPTLFGSAEMLQADEGLLPLHRLHALFQVPDATVEPTEAAVVIVEHEGRRLSLMIDELLGQQQIVIKSLGESLRGVPGIAGGAIMPDGKVGLILDIDGLVRLAGEKRRSHEPEDASL